VLWESLFADAKSLGKNGSSRESGLHVFASLYEKAASEHGT